MSGGHAVAAVADTEAPESRRDTGSSEGSPAALTRHWPVVSVHLPIVDTVRKIAVRKSYWMESQRQLLDCYTVSTTEDVRFTLHIMSLYTKHKQQGKN